MKCLITFLFINTIMFSQNKTIVPTSGTIVFVREDIVLDKDLYHKSYKELMPKMKIAMTKQIFLERLIDGKKTDTILLKAEVDKVSQLYEMMIPIMIDEPKEKIKFHHEFKGDTIIYYNSKDNVDYYNEKTINKVTGIITNELNEYAEIEEDAIIKLTEFKNETKVINGLNCFKVIYSFSDASAESDFDFLSEVTTSIREIWVTDEIKCNFHPIINEKEILEKYYPLEILEYSDEVKGFETTYKLETFTINNA